jgi:hypothetical protein
MAALPHECVTPPTSVSQEKGAGDSSYHIFHRHALSEAFVYSCNTLHQMLTGFQDVCCSNKLTCHETLLRRSLPHVSAVSKPEKLSCLYTVNSCLFVCIFKLDFNLFHNSAAVCSYGMLCMLNGSGDCIKEMIGCVHASTNRYTVCNVEDGFRGDLVNTNAGFEPGCVTNVNSGTVMSCSCEEDIKDSFVSLLEVHDACLVVCVRGQSSSFDLDCNLGHFGSSYFDLNGSKKMVLQVIYNSAAINHFDISTEKVYSNTLGILRFPMTVVSNDCTVHILTSGQRHDIVRGYLIPTHFSEDDSCSGCCTSVTELNVLEIVTCSRYIFESLYDPNRLTPFSNLTHVYPVCEATGSNGTWILQVLCTLQDKCSLSVALKLLNNQNWQGIVLATSVGREQLTFSSEHHEFNCEISNISDTLASLLCQNYGNFDYLALRQDRQTTGCRGETIFAPEWSRVLLQACRESYSVCNFHKHHVQNMPNVADFGNDVCSWNTIFRSFHCALTSLLWLYPFCNCLLLRWLCYELLAGPIVCIPFRYFYRSYHLLCFVSKFRCLFLSVCDSTSLQSRLLFIVCLVRH